MTQSILPRIAIRFKNADGCYTVTFGRFPDGRPSEIFMDGPYSFFGVSRMATVALQHGVPIEAVRGAVIGGPMATAIDRIIAACNGAADKSAIAPSGPSDPASRAAAATAEHHADE